MTATPESWDDVGCLRIQVNSVTQKVEDVENGLAACHTLHDSQLQKLSDAVARMQAQEDEQKKERCHVKICSSIASALLVAVLALQVFSLYNGSASRSTQREITWKAYLEGLERSDAAREGLPENEYLHEKREKIMSRRLHLGLEPKPTFDFPVQSAQHPQGSADAEEERTRSGVNDPEEDRQYEDSNEQGPGLGHDFDRENHQELKRESRHRRRHDFDWEHHHQESTKEPEEPEDPAVTSHAPPLPAIQRNTKGPSFGPLRAGYSLPPKHSTPKPQPQASSEQMFESFEDADSLPVNISWPDKGVFWVCFPPRLLQKKVEKYASLFMDLARNQKWLGYPFCYLDTKRLHKYDEHFCHHVQKVTFVFEKPRSDVDFDGSYPLSRGSPPVSLPGEIPVQSKFDDCINMFHENPALFDIESPQWFKRTFPPNVDIRAPLVEEFLNDVLSGKLPEVLPQRAKKDL